MGKVKTIVLIIGILSCLGSAAMARELPNWVVRAEYPVPTAAADRWAVVDWLYRVTEIRVIDGEEWWAVTVDSVRGNAVSSGSFLFQPETRVVRNACCLTKRNGVDMEVDLDSIQGEGVSLHPYSPFPLDQAVSPSLAAGRLAARSSGGSGWSFQAEFTVRQGTAEELSSSPLAAKARQSAGEVSTFVVEGQKGSILSGRRTLQYGSRFPWWICCETSSCRSVMVEFQGVVLKDE